MKMSRRSAIAISAVTLANLAGQETRPMYGLIGKMKTLAGKRDDFAAILTQVSAGMPGCLSYIVAKDPADSDALWVTEVWESEAAHTASVELPAVKEAIAKGRPLVASFEERHITEPVGGYGIKRQA